MAEEFLVVCAQVICSPGHPFRIVYEWGGEKFSTRAEAIKYGFKIRGSDDFNIIALENGKVAGLYWMDENLNDAEGIASFCEQHGLQAHALRPQKPECGEER